MLAFWQLINAPQNTAFMVALVIMLMLFVLEVLSLILGGIDDWIDGILPDGLGEPAHPEIGLDAVDAGGFVRFLSWLYVGRVPLLMLLVLFLATFGLGGMVLQNVVHELLGFYLPSLIATLVMIFASLPVVRLFASGLHKILPRDETTAISQKDLVGRVGVVVIGVMSATQSAQVRVKDGFGQNHYVMARLDSDEEVGQGGAVLLIAVNGVEYLAIKNSNGVLVD